MEVVATDWLELLRTRREYRGWETPPVDAAAAQFNAPQASALAPQLAVPEDTIALDVSAPQVSGFAPQLMAFESIEPELRAPQVAAPQAKGLPFVFSGANTSRMPPTLRRSTPATTNLRELDGGPRQMPVESAEPKRMAGADVEPMSDWSLPALLTRIEVELSAPQVIGLVPTSRLEVRRGPAIETCPAAPVPELSTIRAPPAPTLIEDVDWRSPRARSPGTFTLPDIDIPAKKQANAGQSSATRKGG
jgi:hypothetical protein